jgi:hypothetical protein
VADLLSVKLDVGDVVALEGHGHLNANGASADDGEIFGGHPRESYGGGEGERVVKSKVRGQTLQVMPSLGLGGLRRLLFVKKFQALVE